MFTSSRPDTEWCFNENYDYMKDLALSDDYNYTTDKSVDLLIGLDFYFSFVTGKVRRGPPSCPVAVYYYYYYY